MKEQNGKDKKTPWWKGEKKLYLFTALGCAAVLLTVIIVAVAVSGNKTQEGKNHSYSSSVSAPEGDNSSSVPDSSGGEGEKPVDGETGMLMPVESVTVSNDYGFWYNKTLNSYYDHKGMDFVAEAGTEVLAVQAGTVESIYKEDLLSGTEIVVDHGNGLKSVYRFVEEAAGLKVGDSVKKGQTIGKIAEANGDEYKEGAHLHFEIIQNGANVDPAKHLTLEEK